MNRVVATLQKNAKTFATFSSTTGKQFSGNLAAKTRAAEPTITRLENFVPGDPTVPSLRSTSAVPNAAGIARIDEMRYRIPRPRPVNYGTASELNRVGRKIGKSKTFADVKRSFFSSVKDE
tara:strand:+ start:600 stop:962 length:363 start_codon:yes stop_codon:yes gene_type:complete